MESDPFEQHDVAAAHPDIVSSLKAQYEAWFKEVGSTRKDNYAPPRIVVGSPHEKTTVLTRQDWRGAAWGPNDEGHWLIDVAGSAAYDVKLIVAAADTERALHLRVGALDATSNLATKAIEHTFRMQRLPTGHQKVEAWAEASGRRVGVRFVELTAQP